MKVLSLFDGISCGRVALERAGLPVSRYVAYEIDKNAITCSAQNWPDIEHRGSVIGADFSEFAGFDLVMGGFPCQDLSIAGKRAGLKGMRSGLFWYLVDAIETIKPRYFFVENNVRMPKEAKRIITETLGVEPMAVDSALVSAQHRERYYWTNIPNVGPPERRDIILSDILCRDHLSPYNGGAFNRTKPDTADRLHRLYKVGHTGTKDNQSTRVYSINGKSITLAGEAGGGGASTGLYLWTDNNIYSLNSKAAALLQGLPENYTQAVGTSVGVNLCGNGWQVDTIEHFFNHMATDMLI